MNKKSKLAIRQKLEQVEINKNNTSNIEYLVANDINHWNISNEFVENLIPMIPKVSTINDYEDAIQLQLVFQQGMYKMLDILRSKYLLPELAIKGSITNGTIVYKDGSLFLIDTLSEEALKKFNETANEWYIVKKFNKPTK